jgi:arachidonate 15-lipoxygenase
VSPVTKEIIEAIYRLATILVNHTFVHRLIISDKYDYDYQILAPLAMTAIPDSIIPKIPMLPSSDELPNPKWLALVLSALSIQAEKKPTVSIDLSSFNEDQINPLESHHKKIEISNGREELTQAILELKSLLGLGSVDRNQELSVKNEGDIDFDKIDREIQDFINKCSQEESTLFLQAENQEQTGRLAGNKELYGHIQDIVRFLGGQLTTNINESLETVENLTTNPIHPSLADYEKLISPLTIKPETLTNFQQDKIFAYMQVAGPNPVMLKQIEIIDPRILITNEQYQAIKDSYKPILNGDSLKAVLKEKRLYLADYSKLNQLAGNITGNPPKYMYAPLALFIVPPDGSQDRNLLPIAICCQQNSGDKNVVFTPLDGDNWMTAKTVLQMADSNYHELISHLAQTHLFIEPFVLATNNCLPDDHFVRVLLKPHFEGTIFINYAAHKSLLAKEGPIDLLLGATIVSDCQLAIEEAKIHLANFNEVAFPRTLEKRGVNNAQQLPIYPYRDDGQMIWDAIHQWVGEYLHLYYDSDRSILSDKQLQQWGHELFDKGLCHIGENADGYIKSLDYLVTAISTIIFTASAQHAAVNFPQGGLMTYAPAFPLGCYAPVSAKSQSQQDFIGVLPPLDRAELQVQILYLLGSVYYTNLIDYSGLYSQDSNLKLVFERFNVKLNEIEAVILKKDAQRLVSYRFFQPSKIPISINI